MGEAPLLSASTYCSIRLTSISPFKARPLIYFAGVSLNTLCFRISALLVNSGRSYCKERVFNLHRSSSSSTGLTRVRSSRCWKCFKRASRTFLFLWLLLLEKLDSLLSRYSFSVICLPFSLNSRAKSRKSQRNFGVYRFFALSPLTLMKLESSVASDKHDIAFSSMVCIELNMKRLLSSTTNANILASWVWFF